MSGNAFQDSRARRKVKRYLRISLLSKTIKRFFTNSIINLLTLSIPKKNYHDCRCYLERDISYIYYRYVDTIRDIFDSNVWNK